MAPTAMRSLGSGMWHAAIQSSSSTTIGFGIPVGMARELKVEEADDAADTTREVGVAKAGDADALGVPMAGVSVVLGRGIGGG